MKLNALLVSGLVVATLHSGGAWAHHKHWHDGGPKHHQQDLQGPDYVWAKVSEVIPITRTISHRVPREKCWTETVRVEEPVQHYQSATGTIVGGIVGGALGHAVGHKKRNKQVGTAVGAILGASIGRDLSYGRDSYETRVSYRDDYRCETYHDVSYDEEVVGYRVFYRYEGKTYETRTDYDPGDRIRVRIFVEPV